MFSHSWLTSFKFFVSRDKSTFLFVTSNAMADFWLFVVHIRLFETLLNCSYPFIVTMTFILTVPLPANFNYPRVIRGLPTSAHSDVLRGHLYLYRCPCWLRNQPATWPWRRGGHLCQVAGGDYIIALRNTASFAQLPVYPICWTSVNKISCWTRLLTSFNCKYGVEWMVDL